MAQLQMLEKQQNSLWFRKVGMGDWQKESEKEKERWSLRTLDPTF